jgi:prepilin-type processing-associated H-X9-DG protein
MVRSYKRKRDKSYSADDLSAAIKKVTEEGAILKNTAEKYHIPQSTLCEHVRDVHSLPHGHACALSKSDEQRIAMCLTYTADCGWPMDRLDLKNMVNQYCKEANIETPWDANNGPGIDFIRNFEKRWQHVLTKKKTVTLTTAKARSLTVDVLEAFFHLVEGVYNKHGLCSRPEAIYNLDETGLNTDQSGGKCFFRRGVKDANIVSPTNGKTVYTVLVCGNANGSHFLPPFVVYRARHLYSKWCQGGPAGTTYASSDSGWMESRLFENWMPVFINHKKQFHGDDAVVLFLDGHSSHLSFSVASLCQANNVSKVVPA